MADARTPRELGSREKSSRAVYVPPSALPDPTPEPGYVYRWVATHILGQSAVSNMSEKMREGWVPVKAADHPELMVLGGDKTGNVEIGGLMLCKIPSERAAARADYYANKNRAQMEAVDNSFMRENNPKMPLFKESSSKVSFGSGR